MGHFIALSSIVGWRENTRTRHVKEAGRVSLNGSCLLNNSVSQIYTHSTPPNFHMYTHIGENNIMGLF